MTNDQPTHSDASTPSSMTTTAPSASFTPIQSTAAETSINNTGNVASPAPSSPAINTGSPAISTPGYPTTPQTGVKRESPDNKQAVETPTKKANYSKDAMGPRGYLDSTVTPILLEGMKLLVQERPEDPLAYLGKFLWSKSNEGKSNSQLQQIDHPQEE